MTKTAFTPHKTYEFLPPSVWLSKIFNQEKFCDLLKAIPEQRQPDVMSDVKHGKLWKEFQMHPDNQEEDLLRNPHNLALILNVDWFDPFKRSKYKIGALYMSILNLPRNERYKLKWTMLVGLIPGPTEPRDNINTFVTPLVNDLLHLWQGMTFVDFTGKQIESKTLLLCVSADLPASRKVTQFKSHKCVRGCDKCMFVAKRQPGTRGASGKMNYATQGRPHRPTLRTKESVYKDAMRFKTAKTKREAQLISKSTGVKYSELLRLPYFDPVRMVVLDPMHSFLLGLVRKETDKHLNSETFNRKYSIYS